MDVEINYAVNFSLLIVPDKQARGVQDTYVPERFPTAPREFNTPSHLGDK